MLLHTSIRNYACAVILDCEGKIMFGEETAFFDRQVKELIKQTKYLVLNLAKVTYIDSWGVGELVVLFTSAKRMGTKIVLAALTGRAKDVLQITKLATIFETYADAEEAAELYKPEAGVAKAPGPE